VLSPGGVFDWYIKIHGGNYWKIGVTLKISSFENAFCDNEGGWGWFISDRQLRRSSNSSGPSYGEAISAGDVVGIHFDSVEGTLSFSKN